jgi:hypothetical protein
VANAKVTITDASKGTKFEVTTDANGNYNKGQLVPDLYKVEIEAAGFQRVVSNEIPVQVDASARYDAALKVGEVTTEVEVLAVAPLLQSDRADISQTFTSKEIGELPNIGRNTQSMELLQPGTARMGWQHASDENPQNSVQMVVDGQLFSQMGYELDGTTNQDPILGIIVINPNIESLAEVKQSLQNFDAEFNFVGAGIASYSTKSGTNEYHGSAFEYNQINTPGFKTVAANPFGGGLPSALYRQNQFGGSIGGAVIKNKLFFFGDAELNRQFQGGSVVSSVPDALSRQGNFSQWLAFNNQYQIFNPTTGNQTTGVGRTPFANNTIPASMISPQAQAIMAYWPSPNTQQISGAPFVNNYAGNGGTAITYNRWDTREDYYLNQKNTIFGRYSYAGFTEAAPGLFGVEAGGPAFVNYAGSSVSRDDSIAIGWTYTASPTLINEFRFGYMRYHVFDVPQGYGTDPATQAGIPGLNLDKTYTSGMPYFNVPSPDDAFHLGYSLGANQCNCPLTQTETQYQFIDNLTKTMGKHSFKFGTDLRYAENLRVPSDSHRAGELSFANGPTELVQANGSQIDGIALASFLLGDVSSFNRYVSSSTNAQERQKRLFFYGQDEWRPTPKWTITMGLRWEMVFPESVNGPGNGATLDLNNGLMYVFGVGGVSSHGIQNMMWHNFAPRLGFAYQLTPKTVIRGGYGWSYDLGVFGSTFGHNVTQNPPVLSNQQLNAPNGFSDVFSLSQGPSTLPPVQVSSNGTFPLPANINPKFRPAVVTLPTVYQYNIAVQHQLTSRIAVQGAYVGNQDRHAFMGVSSNTTNPNEPVFQPGVSATNTLDRPYYSKFGWTNDLSYYCDCASGHYNSFQGLVTIRAWQGWTIQGTYTYQKSWSDSAGGYDQNYYFEYDRSIGGGNSGLFPNRQLTLAQTYDVPFGKGRKWGSNVNRVADAVLGGWELSGITTYYSGFPFSPSIGTYGTNAKPNVGPNNRPNLGSGNPYAGAAGNRTQFFTGCPVDPTTKVPNCSTGPFLWPSSNTFGTYPINTLYGPHFIQQDLSVFKSFKFTERWSFTLRTDARNSFNHTNLGGPNNNVDATNVGQITGLAGAAQGTGMRQLQFSGTLRF